MTTVELPIAITDRALAEALYIFTHKNIPQDYALRIGTKGGGGCGGGASFFIGFDKAKDFDKTFEIGTLRVVIDKRHFMYLLGMELDFEDREHERGFVFNKALAP